MLAVLLLACVPAPPPSVDDPAAGAACLEASSCGEREVCLHAGEQDTCDCAAGFEGPDCTDPCEQTASIGPLEADHWVAPGGIQPQECSGGSRDQPWGGLGVAIDQGCVEPGDVVAITGTWSPRDLFHGGTLQLDGDPERPVVFVGDPGADADHPVRIDGGVIVRGRGIELARLEVVQRSGRDGLQIGGQGITVRDVWVHGTGGSGGSDCIKILGDVELGGEAVRTVGIRVEGSKLEDCPEDAIDVTGARNVVYADNTIARAKLMQVKGGTEDILIERNTFTDVEFGVAGFSMACASYCGSPTLPLFPPERRFVARNVTVRNNRFVGVENIAVVASGWAGAVIAHNTFEDVQTVLTLGRHGSDFVDEAAIAYCDAGGEGCDRCAKARGECARITYPPRDVRFLNNLASGVSGPAVQVEDSGLEVVALHNLWPADALLLDGETPSPLAEAAWASEDLFTDAMLDGDARPVEGSPALDAGELLGVCVDLTGQVREPPPSIGAFER